MVMWSRSVLRTGGAVSDSDGDVRLGLVRRAVEDDELALNALLAESRSRLLNLVSCRIIANLKPAIEADDIVQRAYVDIFRRITKEDKERS